MPPPLPADRYAALEAALGSGDAARVRAAQRDLGVKEDGYAGPLTWGALEARRPKGYVPPMPKLGGPFNRQPRAAVRRYSLRQHGPDFRLSPHFTLVEFACKDGSDEVLIHPALPGLLETIRAHFGAPVHINSAYRTPAHNRRVGGASDSRHVWGCAVDVTVRGATNPQVYSFARSLEPGGLGKYASFTHIDVDGWRRRWNGP